MNMLLYITRGRIATDANKSEGEGRLVISLTIRVLSGHYPISNDDGGGLLYLLFDGHFSGSRFNPGKDCNICNRELMNPTM